MSDADEFRKEAEEARKMSVRSLKQEDKVFGNLIRPFGIPMGEPTHASV